MIKFLVKCRDSGVESVCALAIVALAVGLLPPAAIAWQVSQEPAHDHERYVARIQPVGQTDPVTHDADDPAIWIHPTNPEKSSIIGTDKEKAPGGGIHVFGLDGKKKQAITNVDRPNNVDVEYGLVLGGSARDIAVATERGKHRLRVFAIDTETGLLSDVTGQTDVFVGQTGEAREPMGISLYKRPSDGAIFAIVGRKTGPDGNYIWQYRLSDDGTGKVNATKVREFGRFSGTGEIEAIAVDDALGYVYYSDENFGIRKYHADPDHPDATTELAVFGREGFAEDREGIAIYARPDGTGYIICSDQRKGNSLYRIYKREGEPGKPHDHSHELKVISGGADSTDGIEAASAPLGGRFPKGVLIVMNSGARNFLLFDWRDVERAAPAAAAEVER
ncbi:MAG: phytase [Fimbriimonadia bacterium]|jgi:3-phytase